MGLPFSLDYVNLSMDLIGEVTVDDEDEFDPTEGWYKEEWGEAPMEEPVRSDPVPPAAAPVLLTPRSPIRQVWWEDVADAARWMFDSNWSRHWAARVWQQVLRAGIARYSTELERSRVLVRLLVLGVLFKALCSLCYSHRCVPPDEYDLEQWSRKLGLSPFRIGWLVGHDRGALRGPSESTTEFELTNHGLGALINQELPVMVTALRDHCGSLEALVGFLTEEIDPLPRLDEEPGERSDSCTEGLRNGSEAILAWLKKGCPLGDRAASTECAG